jgi:hypothetical protein
MASFEVRWAGPESTDPESLAFTAVFDGPVSTEARAALRRALAAWGERAEINRFGDWEGYL